MSAFAQRRSAILRVAIFHDYLKTLGGGEKVCLCLAKAFDGDLITTDFDPEVLRLADAKDTKVINLGKVSGGAPLRQIQASLHFAGAEVRGYDFYIFSGNWSRMAGETRRPNLFYCHTPVRAFYDLRERYLRELGPPQMMAAMVWIAAHSQWDKKTIDYMDQIVANSENVKSRIRKYYGRESTVVNPPVPTDRFRFEEVGDYWLSVNRIRPEKRIEMQIDVFRRLPAERLLIVGDAENEEEAMEYVSRLALPPNVELAGAVEEKKLVDLYARCKGLIATAVDEDFGMTPVEAMASGKAVIATDEGGYRETVINNQTGWLLPVDAGAFAERIGSLRSDALEAMRERCMARAREFDEGMFISRMRALVNRALEGGGSL